MALPDTNDPHFFYDDIAAAREEDEAVVEDFFEAATYVEDTSSISAEGPRLAQSKCPSAISCAGGDFNCMVQWSRKLWQTKRACLCSLFSSCLFAMLAYIPYLKNISRHACLYFFACFLSGGGLPIVSYSPRLYQ